MPADVHRLVQNPEDVNRTLAAKTIEEEMSSSSVVSSDMEGAQTGLDLVTSVAVGHKRIVGQCNERGNTSGDRPMPGVAPNCSGVVESKHLASRSNAPLGAQLTLCANPLSHCRDSAARVRDTGSSFLALDPAWLEYGGPLAGYRTLPRPPAVDFYHRLSDGGQFSGVMGSG